MPLFDDVDAVYKGTTRLDRAYLNGAVIPLPLRRHGHNQTHLKAPYYAYSSMWGIYVPGNESMTYSLSQTVYPDLFPSRTRFTWDVTPDPSYGGINGYPHIGYGNFDSSPTTITSRQVYTITNMSIDATWTWKGDTSSGMLSECWLTETAHPTGTVTGADVRFEIGFFPRVSDNAKGWIGSNQTVGTYTDRNGVAWVVGEAGNSQSTPYFFSYRNGFIDHQGELSFADLFAFLIEKRKITGAEWFNGVAFGAEPHTGASSLTVDTYSAVYTGSPRVPWTVTSLIATTLTESSVRLNWTPAAGATSHQYRINGGAWTNTGAADTQTVGGLSATTMYSFEVRGQNSTGNAMQSNTATVTTPGVTTLFPDTTLFPATNLYPIG